MTRDAPSHRTAPPAGATVADVARAAGVSQMTVSRVVNRAANVRPETRERVERAVAALGYVPNAAARSLAGGGQLRVALVHGNPSAAYLSELLVGSLSGAHDRDVLLIVEQRDDREAADAFAARLAVHRVDAVLLPPPLCEDPPVLAALAGAGIAVAQVATGRAAAGAQAVSIADEAAAHAMTTYLIGLGHRRIGFVAGDPNQSASALRRDGYARALREADFAVDRALIAPADFTYRSGLAAAEALLSLDRPPTAIFASNDDMAAAALAVAHRRHRDVPDQLSVCGFDDTMMATAVWPPLTTIRQPIAAMAREAIAMLADAARLARRGHGIAGERRTLDFELIVRGSSASPR